MSIFIYIYTHTYTHTHTQYRDTLTNVITFHRAKITMPNYCKVYKPGSHFWP